MYEVVKTIDQQKEFEQTWEYFCEKYQWVNDPYSKKGIRYNIVLPDKIKPQDRRVIGTIEFIPYDPQNQKSTVESRCRFSKYEQVMKFQKRTWEIDKFCIHEDYQRQGYFKEFLYVFYDHAMKTNSKYYIGLMEKKFYRMVRILFGFNLHQMGKEFKGPTTSLLPVLFDIDRVIKNQKTVNKLLGSRKSTEEYKCRKANFFLNRIQQLISRKSI